VYAYTVLIITNAVAAAVYMVARACFDTSDFTRITGKPDHFSIEELQDQVACIAAPFKMSWYSGTTGCLAIGINADGMHRVARNSSLDCSQATKPALLNHNITSLASNADVQTLANEHKVTLDEYYLVKTINHYGITTVAANVEH